MKVLTFNVRNWTRDCNNKKPTFWKNRADDMSRLILNLNPDIIFFQELMWPMSNYVPILYEKITQMTSHSIWVKKDQFKVMDREWHLRYAFAQVKDKETKQLYNLFSVHTHWDPDIFDATLSNIKDRIDYGVINIAGGDWNNEYSEIKDKFILNPIVPTSVTFKNWETGKTAILDYFGTVPKLTNAVIQVINKPNLSDHYPVLLTI